MTTPKTLINVLFAVGLLGLFALPHVGWAEGKSLLFGRNLERPQIVPTPELESCVIGDPCDDHDDCTDDFCSIKAGGTDSERRVVTCRHTPNDHCGGPPLISKIPPVAVPMPAPPVEPSVEKDPPVVETPPVAETPAPAPVAEPTPETLPSIDIKFDCSAAPEDTIAIDGRDVIFAVNRKGKRTPVTLKAIPVADGTSAALAEALNGAEKIELVQTGGSELILIKSGDLENADAALTADAVVIEATGNPGLVPTGFSFDSPIPVAPDRSGVETYSFKANLVDGEGRTLASAVADCQIGLQVGGGGGIGGCSLVDGEFETTSLLGLFGIFLFAWGTLCLAEKWKRSKK